MKKRLPIYSPAMLIYLLIPLLSHGQEDWMSRGFRLLRARQFEQAVTAFSRAIDDEPENAEAYNHRGVARAYMGKTDQAITDYSKALDLKPELVGALNNRGSAFYQKGLLNQAISDYSKAIEINPYLAEAYSNRGTAWAAKGDYFRAIRDYTQALETNPYFDAPYYNRGRALSAIGDYGQAVGDLERAISLNPEFHAAYDLLARIYGECPDPEIRNPGKAVTFAQQAVELKPSPEYLGTLAAAHTEAGNLDQAVLAQQRALEMLRQQGRTDLIAAYEKDLSEILEKKRNGEALEAKKAATEVSSKAKPPSLGKEKEKRPDEKPGEKTPKAEPAPPTTVKTPEEKKVPRKTYTIQAGAFLSQAYADNRHRHLVKKGYDVRVVTFTDRKGKLWYTVRIGRYESLKTARNAAAAIADKEKIKTSVRPGGAL